MVALILPAGVEIRVGHTRIVALRLVAKSDGGPKNETGLQELCLIFLAGEVGLEPTIPSARNWCLTIWPLANNWLIIP